MIQITNTLIFKSQWNCISCKIFHKCQTVVSSADIIVPIPIFNIHFFVLGDFEEDYIPDIYITAEPKEHELINKVLMDFASAPLTYELSEMVPEEDMLEMAAICENLRKELYEFKKHCVIKFKINIHRYFFQVIIIFG